MINFKNMIIIKKIMKKNNNNNKNVIIIKLIVVDDVKNNISYSVFALFHEFFNVRIVIRCP